MLAEATGFEPFADSDYLDRASERIVTLERAFNNREGFRRKDDTLPLRFTTEPLKNAGPYTGEMVRNLEGMIDEYYRLMGYDNDGVPTPERLEALSIGYVSEDLKL